MDKTNLYQFFVKKSVYKPTFDQPPIIEVSKKYYLEET